MPKRFVTAVTQTAGREGGERVRAARRAAAVLLLTAGAFPLAPLVAHADTATPPAVKTAWYWSLVGVSAQGEDVPVAPPAAASLVPDGDIGVGYLLEQEDTVLNTHGADRVGVVAFDLNTVPMGSTFSSFVATVPLDGAAQQVMTGTPELQACELIGGFVDTVVPGGATAAPPFSLVSCVKGTFKDTIGDAGAYVFDLTAIANDWSGGAPAEGILIRPTGGLPTAQQPFLISLQGKNGITTSAVYTPPPPPVPSEPPVVLPGPVLPPVPVLPGFVPPPTLPDLGGIVVPAAPVPAPQVNPAPSAPALSAVAYTQGALVPSGLWWAGFLAFVLLLGLTAAVLGDPLAPVVVDPRRRRFAEVVRAQARAAGPASGRPTRPSARFRPA